MAEDSIIITVSDKADIDWIRSKVKDGQYASESQAIAEGISRLREDDTELETWVREVAAERYDQLKLHPESGIPLEQVVKNLKERRSKRVQQNG